MYRVAVLVSGGGSNLRAIISAVESGTLKCRITAVISDQPGTGAINTAVGKEIPNYVFSRNNAGPQRTQENTDSSQKDFADSISDRILKILKDNTDLIVCAGFLSILDGNLLKEFHNRIINIHPALIPSFCGKGMYGMRVHQAVLEYGVKISGCTVHFLESGVDTGPVILQRSVNVLQEDRPEDLQQRIIKEEHIAIVEAVRLISEGRVVINDRKVLYR